MRKAIDYRRRQFPDGVFCIGIRVIGQTNDTEANWNVLPTTESTWDR
jgi:hypothetical protein